MAATLEERLERIRTSPKLQSQQQTHSVLNAVEDTLRDQDAEFTPTAYFTALLLLLGQYISSKGVVNKDVATAIVYLLDLVTPYVPAPLLRAKFSQILQKLATVLTYPDAEAPLLRPSIGCLESLLIIQDAPAWALPQSQISPRRAVAGLLAIAVDHRPKVRKRAHDALAKVLKNPPPSPALDHPAADMCAESALRTLKAGVEAAKKQKKHHKERDNSSSGPNLIHTLQLIKTLANASGGWPSRKIDSLCELLLNISRSSTEYMTMASFEVFEVMFAGMADEVSSAKLPHLLEVLKSLQPSENDSQLLPPWIAVLSRGYDVSSQVMPDETFQKLPEIFSKVAGFMRSVSHNIRVSAADCLISFLVNCVPTSVILDPSIYDEKVLEKLAKTATDLLSVKYQTSWMDVFRVIGAMFDTLHWHSATLLPNVVKLIGQLRANEQFAGKKEAEAVLSKAIQAMGPSKVLEILPLNLAGKTNAGGRVWLLPIMRDAVGNTLLGHFRTELVPLSENMFQRVLNHGDAEKTVEIKIYETIVHQIWATLPGYCDLPTDLIAAFDQSFAEILSNLLYQQIDLRTDLCRALQRLVDSNKERIALPDDDPAAALLRVSKSDAEANLRHLEAYANNLLAVLFNVYTQTLPQYRAPILQCINSYISITPEKELVETFGRVTAMLESSLAESNGQSKEKHHDTNKENPMPPMSHTLMDLVITISVHLPRSSLAQLFSIASLMLGKNDPNLQKKAYKLIPRLADSETGRAALQERSGELQALLLDYSESTSPAALRDRLAALGQIVEFLPSTDLHFLPAVLPEVTIATKEANEKARTMAFDLLVAMGEKMGRGGTVDFSKVPHMAPDSPPRAASLEEYLTMVSAGLAGTAPHSISASITAVTRVLYHFRHSLPEEAINQLLMTMDMFLNSPNREIVRSVLGFVKVSVISLPMSMIRPRLETLIPNLLNWSHEHKAHLQAKVKHIFERMVRRFGVEEVERWTPDSDKKLIANIRKTRERRKKKKSAAEDDAENNADEQPEAPAKRKSKFESGYDEAVYGSDDASSDSGSDISDDEVLGRKQRRGRNAREAFIVEDEDEPLDLLDRRAIGNISSTRPLKKVAPKGKRKAKVDLDGKLILGDEDENDVSMRDADAEAGANIDETESGINAYVEAIKGGNAPRRGQKGKLKFSNRPRNEDDGEDDDMAMDTVDAPKASKKAQSQQRTRGSGASFARGRGGRGGGLKAARTQRKGLGEEKTRGGRVGKGSPGKVGRH